ncbi:hypothetical protein I302_106613 [Kwoniella bestiolae CBS 10118]|uniref:Uncharacterized protein n=1 Tax=Kwoniella bestiolae CBS 10118 TaxID=1296100 RepID=A0A1B9G0W1_9TREE|nr:hypothetical protein I302_06125 [Kwoniella bestiolae CBS 10118]OCF24664.1 hypothetical protein I302_06125 [Kwoniella bestiolae CBS 10118]
MPNISNPSQPSTNGLITATYQAAPGQETPIEFMGKLLAQKECSRSGNPNTEFRCDLELEGGLSFTQGLLRRRALDSSKYSEAGSPSWGMEGSHIWA